MLAATELQLPFEVPILCVSQYGQNSRKKALPQVAAASVGIFHIQVEEETFSYWEWAGTEPASFPLPLKRGQARRKSLD